MAQSKNSRKKVGGEVYPYPSRFGSHASMKVCEDPTDEENWKEEYADALAALSPGEVLLEDEFGTYVTLEHRLDNGLTDTYRTDSIARPKILKR